MDRKTITLTVVANMTSNYSENLGNIGSVQKVYRRGHVYAIRSRESLKNAIMVQSGMYDDLVTTVDGATQKQATPERNASNNRALEGGYMTTGKDTYIRNSSFYLTDAVACEPFVNETRFHNNLYLAGNYARANGLNLQKDAGRAGLIPYQYEYDKSLRVYSITIDLDMIGRDPNFTEEEATGEEKAARVNSLLSAVENLSLIVRGNLDNAEPVFVVGGFSDRKTHYFENVVKVLEGKLVLSEDLIQKLQQGYSSALLRGHNFDNEDEIVEKLHPTGVAAFFETLRSQVKEYYSV
ncbi:MAG: type I-B CRISPR-associated protein Cas7/Cst2/DevR [Lachnospiraceae bacterium]|jgi:CRISPR-associated protein Cst2|nr:type I-B CRISPR-associated protein Cas7/Cst2/DevR [Lachnospiraceae bacterium]